MAQDATLIWTAQAVSPFDIVRVVSPTKGLAWTLGVVGVVLWLIVILAVSFINEVFLLRGTDDHPTTFQLVKRAAKGFGRYFMRSLLLLSLIGLGAVLPGVLIGRVVDPSLGVFIAALSSMILVGATFDWVTPKGIQKLSVLVDNILTKSLRALGATVTAAFIWVSIDAMGTLLISIGGLVDRMPTLDTREDFELPLIALLGNSQWSLGLRAIFVVLGLTIATAFWVNSRLIQQELDIQELGVN